MNTLKFGLMVLVLVGCSKQEAPEESAPQAPAAAASTAIEVPDFEVSDAPSDIEKGEQIFAGKGCVACHKVGGGKLVGPDLKGVLSRRDEVWVKKMILRPDVMLKEDETARKLLAEHMTPMPNQAVDPKGDLPYLMAYLKSVK